MMNIDEIKRQLASLETQKMSVYSVSNAHERSQRLYELILERTKIILTIAANIGLSTHGTSKLQSELSDEELREYKDILEDYYDSSCSELIYIQEYSLSYSELFIVAKLRLDAMENGFFPKFITDIQSEISVRGEKEPSTTRSSELTSNQMIATQDLLQPESKVSPTEQTFALASDEEKLGSTPLEKLIAEHLNIIRDLTKDFELIRAAKKANNSQKKYALLGLWNADYSILKQITAKLLEEKHKIEISGEDSSTISKALTQNYEIDSLKECIQKMAPFSFAIPKTSACNNSIFPPTIEAKNDDKYTQEARKS